MAEEGKWILLTTAPDQPTAEMWQEMLSREGIPVVVSPADAVSFMGVSPLPCRLMVIGDYLEQARGILESLESAERQEPPEG